MRGFFEHALSADSVQRLKPRAWVVTAAAQIIDLDDDNPAWRDIRPMAHPRWFANSALLPDGTLFVCGGGRTTGSDPVMEPEIFDPASQNWTTDVPMEVARLYHSTALLLPDGRVWVAGTDGETCMEVHMLFVLDTNGMPAMAPIIQLVYV
jgi:hypothetical protein